MFTRIFTPNKKNKESPKCVPSAINEEPLSKWVERTTNDSSLLKFFPENLIEEVATLGIGGIEPSLEILVRKRGSSTCKIAKVTSGVDDKPTLFSSEPEALAALKELQFSEKPLIKSKYEEIKSTVEYRYSQDPQLKPFYDKVKQMSNKDIASCAKKISANPESEEKIKKNIMTSRMMLNRSQ